MNFIKSPNSGLARTGSAGPALTPMYLPRECVRTFAELIVLALLTILYSTCCSYVSLSLNYYKDWKVRVMEAWSVKLWVHICVQIKLSKEICYQVLPFLTPLSNDTQFWGTLTVSKEEIHSFYDLASLSTDKSHLQTGMLCKLSLIAQIDLHEVSCMACCKHI